MAHLRIGLLFDYKQENWPSMDISGQELFNELDKATLSCQPIQLRAPYLSLFSNLGKRKSLNNVDRLINRMLTYPSWLKWHSTFRDDVDIYHLVDHSYSQLIHSLKGIGGDKKVGVLCHDLDTFRCVLEPEKDPRPLWFQAMAQRILSGFQKADWVFYTTNAVKTELLKFELIPQEKLVQAPLGVNSLYSEQKIEGEKEQLKKLNSRLGDKKFLLNVGSTIPRKRIDILIKTFAELVKSAPELELVQVGGTWTAEQENQIKEYGLSDRVIQLRGISVEALAALYRNCEFVIQPSEAEGFGLPIIEALACGAPILASDLPVFREVAGDQLIYAPVGDVDAWSQKAKELLTSPELFPKQESRIEKSRIYRWSSHAETILNTYLSDAPEER